MKKSKFTEAQIVSTLKQVDACIPMKDICRQDQHSPEPQGRSAWRIPVQ